MKILFHHRIASRDGQAVHMDELCAALSRQGHSIVLVGPARTARLEFGGDAGAIGILKKRLPRALYEILELGYNLVAAPRLWLAIRRHRPDAVYERYNLFLLAGALICPLLRMPLLLEINAPLREERERVAGLGLPRLAACVERLAWRAADFALPVTHVLAGYVRGAGVADDRIVVIPNGIDRAKFATPIDARSAKQRLGLEGCIVLGFTGFVRAWNNLDRVLDIMTKLGRNQDIRLLLVGDGPAVPELKKRAASLGLIDRLIITGIVAREVVAEHIAAFDIALQPGVTSYASPLKLFEYMATGVSIVAPDQENIREILTDRHDALLISPDEPEQLEAAIVELIRDEGLRARLGKAARETIERRGLTWSNNANTVITLIRRLIDRRVTSGLDTRVPATTADPLHGDDELTNRDVSVHVRSKQ